jgi:SpoIID/LytB domain protein
MHYHYKQLNRCNKIGCLLRKSSILLPSIAYILCIAVSILPKDLSARLPSADNYHVRVLLDAQDIGTSQWVLQATGGFIIYDRHDRTKKDIIPDQQLDIRCQMRGIIINNKRYLSEAIVITPVHSHEPIGYDTHLYQGIFLVIRWQDRALLINRVELEDYIFSVLRTESFPGWPLEVNKVFAIASRSYALAMIMNAQKSSLPYHIRNTNHHQTYTGLHTFKHLRTAVDDTKGIFIAHKGKPIVAMFDICCGGIIPAQVSGFDFIKAPYLARTYPCTFCKQCKLYEWQTSYSFQELASLLKPAVHNMPSIQDVRITTYDKAGLVKKVTIHGAKAVANLTGKRIYSLLKNIRSLCFSVQKNTQGILLKGRGYGHHLGICQWGVRAMERAGHTYSSIVSFYYPHTTCMRLRYT